MSFSRHVGFFGNAPAAITFDAKVFGASDLPMNKFSDMPADQRPPGTDATVMHAQFSAGPGAPCMGCDIPPRRSTPSPGRHSLLHAAPDAAKAAAIFAGLS